MTDTMTCQSNTKLLVIRNISLTCEKMEHPNTQGGGEAPAQAGADPNEAAEEHQGQRHQGQEKLASPEICKDRQ